MGRKEGEMVEREGREGGKGEGRVEEGGCVASVKINSWLRYGPVQRCNNNEYQQNDDTILTFNVQYAARTRCWWERYCSRSCIIVSERRRS